MVNSEEFSARLQLIMQHHDLNASSFAEKINVGRSSISHILSGRNKPSLDFVLAILKTFEEVDLYWLLNGKGNYPKKTNSDSKVSSLPTPVSNKNSKNKTATDEQEISSKRVKSPDQDKDLIDPKKGKYITKVILIYNDGTFENFIP